MHLRKGSWHMTATVIDLFHLPPYYACLPSTRGHSCHVVYSSFAKLVARF